MYVWPLHEKTRKFKKFCFSTHGCNKGTKPSTRDERAANALRKYHRTKSLDAWSCRRGKTSCWTWGRTMEVCRRAEATGNKAAWRSHNRTRASWCVVNFTIFQKSVFNSTFILEKDLRSELNAEIERSGALAAKANRVPSSTSRGRGRPAGVDDPKHAEVVRFYEDVTNLLIPGMKAIPGQYLELDEWVLTCIYTFFDEKEDDPQSAALKSQSFFRLQDLFDFYFCPSGFNFNLRLCHEPDPSQDQPSEPVTSKDQLLPMVYFTPQNLDMEPMEYVEKLDFLKEPFSFGRHQLPLFLRTLYQRMSDALKQSDGDDDSVQEVDALWSGISVVCFMKSLTNIKIRWMLVCSLGHLPTHVWSFESYKEY